ncbi:MAG: hypothetical protein A3K12_16050 [Candidatus Rokubacteria bacterium RIFCSPLOWO2_12_FULL_71_19]|nr:MAG: hypothetical protein A3K12_16050 [Candidatus Rokubacteria bacterium RIFCSPLOWO2_12_FULL_71_19]
MASDSSLIRLMAMIADFSASHCALSLADVSLRSASSASSRPRRSRETSSDSRATDTRSIPSCMIRRSISSTSPGSESISMRRREAASSTRSMALSGRKRSAM